MGLEPYALSLAGTLITDIPVCEFAIPGLEFLHLGGTRLQSLPKIVAQVATSLWYLSVARTNVSVLWKWMDPVAQRAFVRSPYPALRAFGTPWCREMAEILAKNRTTFSTNETEVAIVMDVTTPEKLVYAKTAVTCYETSASFFPLAFEDLQETQAALDFH